MKRITFAAGCDFVDSVYAATAAGYHHDAFKKVSVKLDEMAEAGALSDCMLDRLHNYNMECLAVAESDFQDVVQSVVVDKFGADAIALGVEYSKKGLVAFWAYRWEDDDAVRAYQFHNFAGVC